MRDPRYKIKSATLTSALPPSDLLHRSGQVELANLIETAVAAETDFLLHDGKAYAYSASQRRWFRQEPVSPLAVTLSDDGLTVTIGLTDQAEVVAMSRDKAQVYFHAVTGSGATLIATATDLRYFESLL